MDIRSRIRRPGACAAALFTASLLGALVVAGVASVPGIAAGQAASTLTPIAPEAKAILERMAGHIQKAGSIQVTADLAWDSVQIDGQKLEFGETRKISLRRPDRLRVETERRSGARRGMVFDGKEIAVFDYDEKAYASVPKTGTVDEVVDYARGDLGVRMPLAELFASDFVETLLGDLREADVIGVDRIGGAAYDHVAFRTEAVDGQVWVAQGAAPLVRRVVLTYRTELGQPQFRADLRDWNLTASLPDSTFQIAAPAGAERVPLAAPAAAPAVTP